jgi:PKD repeat protein
MSVADTVVHIYAAPGTYVVTVTVVDDDGGANLLVFSVTLP